MIVDILCCDYHLYIHIIDGTIIVIMQGLSLIVSSLHSILHILTNWNPFSTPNKPSKANTETQPIIKCTMKGVG